MIGQICEVRNIADNLVSGGSKAAREARVRTLANLLTTRSNAFSIWVVGQAIADANKDGVYQVFAGDEILSEVIVHAVVERYEDSTNQVRFRIRNIHYYTN
jgi:hypothetical protein